MLLLLVVIGRGRPGQYLSLAMLLIALAVGVWYTTIRSVPSRCPESIRT